MTHNDDISACRDATQRIADALAARTPTPGGGAAACWSAGIAVGLARMVVAYSIGKGGDDQHLEQIDERLASIADRLVAFGEEDARAYQAVVDAKRDRKAAPGDDADKRVEDAESLAVEPPLAALAQVCEAVVIVLDLAGKSNRWLESDRLASHAMLVGTGSALTEFVRVGLSSRGEGPRALAEQQLANAEEILGRRST